MDSDQGQRAAAGTVLSVSGSGQRQRVAPRRRTTRPSDPLPNPATSRPSPFPGPFRFPSPTHPIKTPKTAKLRNETEAMPSSSSERDVKGINETWTIPRPRAL